jgi:hypothetical protein
MRKAEKRSEEKGAVKTGSQRGDKEMFRKAIYIIMLLGVGWLVGFFFFLSAVKC